jgi:NNMT/PNMT/TEMT family
MVETTVVTQNADVEWADFPSEDYWDRNYKKLLPPDRKILQLVGSFFSKTCSIKPRVQRAVDVGSGTNLYPALLMLPWANQILLTDYSESNVRWLRSQVMDDDVPWTWQPFWCELRTHKGYNQISQPRKPLREACTDAEGRAAIERRSVVDPPRGAVAVGHDLLRCQVDYQRPDGSLLVVGSFSMSVTICLATLGKIANEMEWSFAEDKPRWNRGPHGLDKTEMCVQRSRPASQHSYSL